MEQGSSELLLAKASYDVMLYQAAYATLEEELAFLKQEYAVEATEDAVDRVAGKARALEQLLIEWGVDLAWWSPKHILAIEVLFQLLGRRRQVAIGNASGIMVV